MRGNEIIKQVEWKSTSKFGDSNNTELNKMYTESLNDILIMPNEEITVYVYYKVNREEINIDTDTEYKYGNYIILDNAINGKRNIAEINSYRALDYVEKNVYQMNLNEIGGSRVDIDSNPGNIDNNSGDLNAFQTYEDDTEAAPLLRVTVNSSNGKEISGYVFEDLRTEKLANNQWVGNSKLDSNEKYIDNVFVELIRMEYNPDLDNYEEVKFSDEYEKYLNAYNENIKKNYTVQYENGEIALIKIKRRTGPQEAQESLLNTEAFIANGQYRFINLIESGKYKVRFLYGDEEQLKATNDGIVYNGHDYKSTEFKGFYNQNLELTDLSNLNLIDSAEIKILSTNLDYQIYANKLQNKLQSTYGDFEIENKEAILKRDIYNNLELTQGEYLDQYIVWLQMKDLDEYNILEENKEKLKNYFCINTTSTSNIELYPFESRETNDEQGISSISLYVSFKKALAEEDFNFKNALEYNNFVEIIETYSINGRRDKDSSVGNLIPNKTDENDSDNAEVVRILPPFGIKDYIRYGLYILVLTGTAVVIIMFRKKNK